MATKHLSQNDKMKRSSNIYDVYNWGIPAFLSETGLKTCPNAGFCAVGCYARSGSYRYSNVKNKYEERLVLARSDQFETELVADIKEAQRLALKRGKQDCIIRIHDSGDFFSDEYAQKWFNVIRQFPTVVFYAYTKQVSYFKSLADTPENLIMIYSYGGKQDHLIDPERDRHSKVFENETELLDAGYADASHNDMVAIDTNHKIGLIYHGSKKYANTKWDKVS